MWCADGWGGEQMFLFHFPRIQLGYQIKSSGKPTRSYLGLPRDPIDPKEGCNLVKLNLSQNLTFLRHFPTFAAENASKSGLLSLQTILKHVLNSSIKTLKLSRKLRITQNCS